MRPWIWFEPVAGQGRQRRPTDGTIQALFLSAGAGLGSWTLAPAPTRAREQSLRPVGRRGLIHRHHPPDTHAEAEPASQASGRSEAAASLKDSPSVTHAGPSDSSLIKESSPSRLGSYAPFACAALPCLLFNLACMLALRNLLDVETDSSSLAEFVLPSPRNFIHPDFTKKLHTSSRCDWTRDALLGAPFAG